MMRRLRLVARLRGEDGFTLIEVLAAIVLLTGGILALAATLDRSRELTNTSEKQVAGTHVAEQALDEILARPYEAIAVTCDPRIVSPAPANACAAAARYSQATSTAYRSSAAMAANSGAGEPMVVEPDDTSDVDDPVGQVSHVPTDWFDARTGARGKIYRFVSCAGDPSDANRCLSGAAYKRVVVAVDFVKGDPRRPVLLNTFVVDPRLGKTSAAGPPCGTGTCQDDQE